MMTGLRTLRQVLEYGGGVLAREYANTTTIVESQLHQKRSRIARMAEAHHPAHGPVVTGPDRSGELVGGAGCFADHVKGQGKRDA